MMFECKKLFFKQKGLLILALLLLIKIGVVFFSGYDSHFLIEQNEKTYKDYMNQYSGKITKDTTQQIKKEYDAVNRAESGIDNLVTKWKKGEISQEEYESQCIRFYDKQKNVNIFKVVYSKYTYAKEQVEERYLLDSRGWETLLTHDTLDLVLILCLITILTPLFCEEYESKMEVLLLSTKRGKYRSGGIKLILGILSAVFITLLFHLIQVLYLNFTVGLEHGQYPLQSLEFFRDSGYHITLRKAYLIVVAFRVLGAVLLGCMVTIIGILSKKSIITLVSSNALTILPAIIFQNSSNHYYLPFPTGWLQGTGYLWPSAYKNIIGDAGEQVSMITFKEIELSSLNVLLIIAIGEILLILLYSFKKYSGDFLFLNSLWRWLKKSTRLLSVIIMFTILLTGCGDKQVIKDRFCYNIEENAYYGEGSGYKVQVQYEENNIEITNTQTGKSESLLKDVFSEKMEICGIFVSENICYYLVESGENEEVCIYSIDLRNFTKDLVYSSIKENEEDFFGLVSKEEKIEDIVQAELTSGFFLDFENIYIIKNSKVVQINKKTKKENVIIDDLSLDGISYFNGSIYYVDQRYRLCEFNTNSMEVIHVENIYTRKFTIKENRIEYYNLLLSKQIQYYDLEP